MTSKHSPLIIAVLLLFVFFFTYFQLSVIYLFFPIFPFIFLYILWIAFKKTTWAWRMRQSIWILYLPCMIHLLILDAKVKDNILPIAQLGCNSRGISGNFGANSVREKHILTKNPKRFIGIAIDLEQTIKSDLLLE